MKKTFSLIIISFLFINARVKDIERKEINLDLIIYQWTSFTLSELELPLNCKIEVEGKAVLEKHDSIFRILPLDTTEIIVKFTSVYFEKSISLTPKNNVNFNVDWTNLKNNERPTPLTKEEARVYYNYVHYKILDKPIRNFNLKTLTGQKLDSTIFKGKVTFLNFWFYGCVPCMAEMPAINKLNEYYKENSQVQLFSMFRDSIKIHTKDSLLFQSKGYSTITNKKYRYVDNNLVQVPSCGGYMDVFSIYGFPTSLIIDQNGIVRFINVGANGDSDNSELTELYIKKIDEINN